MIKGHYGQRARERAGSLLEAVGLKSRLRHKPSELSGGEAQRVAVARSLINEPEIVLCDEPTGNLDSHMSKEVWSILRGLNKEKNQTFVIVTHDESFAQGTDRVLHLKDGALEKTRT